MNRQSLAPDRGMIFPFEPPQAGGFWMKNTLIPLDMIFVRADGSIANIEANTVPLSLEPVLSDEPVAAVLEIAGGRSAELGIKAGRQGRMDARSSCACLPGVTGQRRGHGNVRQRLHLVERRLLGHDDRHAPPWRGSRPRRGRQRLFPAQEGPQAAAG